MGSGPDHSARPRVVITPKRFDAAIFDLDGVLTDTARIHARAWKAVFDRLLQAHAAGAGVPYAPFDIAEDYRAYVDGRTRLDGIRTFLASRGITRSETAAPGDDSVAALGARKAELFLRELADGIEALPGAASLLQDLRAAGIRVGVASASKNCAAVLAAAKLDALIDVRVDGLDAERLGLPGKPDPSLFLEAARRLDVAPARAIMFEDALAGIEAGVRGGFACVIGVARGEQVDALRTAGAEAVIGGLHEVAVGRIPQG